MSPPAESVELTQQVNSQQTVLPGPFRRFCFHCFHSVSTASGQVRCGHKTFHLITINNIHIHICMYGYTYDVVDAKS